MNIKLRTYVYSSFAIAAIEAVLGILCYILFFDVEIGYFNDSFFNKIFTALIIVSIIAAAIAVKFIVPASEIKEKIAPCKYSAIFPALGYAISAVFFASVYVYNHFTNHIQLAVCLLSIIAAIYYIMKLFDKSAENISAICGFGAIILNLSMIFITYTDYAVAMNSPVKIYLHFACAAAAVSVLLELRAILRTSAKRMRLFAESVSLILCGVTSVSQLAACIFGKLDFSYFIIIALSLLGVAVYSAASLLAECDSAAASQASVSNESANDKDIITDEDESDSSITGQKENEEE